jgi:hypothetical protein
MRCEALIFRVGDPPEKGAAAQFLRVIAADVVPAPNRPLKLQEDMLGSGGADDFKSHRCVVCGVVEFIPHVAISMSVFLRSAKPPPSPPALSPI